MKKLINKTIAVKTKDVSLTVWFTPAEMRQIQAYCEVGGYNRSAIIRKALALYMATQPILNMTRLTPKETIGLIIPDTQETNNE